MLEDRLISVVELESSVNSYSEEVTKLQVASGARDATVNRAASHNYFLEDRLEAGIALTGSEVKSVRAGRANLKDAYAMIRSIAMVRGGRNHTARSPVMSWPADAIAPRSAAMLIVLPTASNPHAT